MKTTYRFAGSLALYLVVAALLSMHATTAQAQLRVLPGDATVAAAAGNQVAPAIAQGGSALLAVWSDSRSNPTSAYEYETSKDIYGVRLDANGNVLDAVPIAIAAGKSSQENPKVSWNGTHWLVVFESYDLGGTGYYYQKSLEAVRVSPAGQVIDTKPIKLTGLTPSAGYYWNVASDGVNWVVVNQGTSTSGDIVAMRISADGVVLDPPTRSLLEAAWYGRANVKLAFAAAVYLMTFDDEYVNGTFDTKAVRFDGNLNLLDTTPISLLATPLSDLASKGSEFYILWNRQEPNFSTVLAGSRVTTAGQKLDGNGVNVSGANTPQYGTTTAVVWDGVNWRITWGANNLSRVARVTAAGQVLDFGGVPLTGPMTGPSAGDGAGGVQIVWSAFANNNDDVYSAKVSPSNTAGPNRTLSVGTPRQLRANMATSGSGYMLAYHSATASENRVMAQPLDGAGNAIGNPIQLATGDPLNGPGSPAVAWNGSVYLVVWGTPSGVVAQRLSATGGLLDAAPFTVMSPAFGPAAVAALGSDFLVAGRQIGFNIQYIFPVVARVSGAGMVLDATPRILGQSYVGRRQAVAALGSRWLVAWIRNMTHDDPSATTQGAFVNADGTFTAEFQIHGTFSTTGGNAIFELGLGANGSEALMVQSQELTSGVETDLLGRFIQADGAIGAMFNLTPWSGNQYAPRVAWDGTNFIVVFQDQKNRLAEQTLDQLDARSDLFGMRVSPAGAIVDPQGFLFSGWPTSETDPNVTAAGGVALIAGSVVLNDSVNANYRIVYEQLGTGGNPWPVAVATATPSGGDVPLTVNFSSTGSTDPGGAIVSYAWDFGDGATSTLANPSHSYTTGGPYVVTLNLADNGGASTTQTVLVMALNPNQMPVAVAAADKTSGNPPLDVIFFADGSYDPDGFVGNIEWLFSDGGSYWGSPAYHTFTNTGTHTVTLRVYDSRGAIGATTLNISVGGANQPPVANASAAPTSGTVPLTVAFSSAGSYDPDGAIAAYLWNFGAGLGSSSDPNPTYIYGTAGSYTATLTVTDNNGASATRNVLITVNPTSLPTIRSSNIVLSATLKRGTVKVNGTVSVTDAAGVNQSGATVFATWTLPGGTTQNRSAMTNSLGQAKFNTSAGSGTYTLTVTNITKSGFIFDNVNGVLSKSITK